MSEFCTVFLWIVSVVCAVEGATSSVTTTVSTTSSIPITLSPVKKINYTLQMFNDGPVVLDGIVTFTARLVDKKGKVTQSKEFLYEWNNNADKKFTSVRGDLEYTYVRQFSSASTRQGQWIMNLAVYAVKDHEQVVNFNSTKFVLTETLNGALAMKQDLLYQRSKNVFATDKAIMLFADHTDKFVPSAVIVAPTFQFFWYKDNEFQGSTSLAHYNLTLDREGNFTIQSELYAFFGDSQKLGQNSSTNIQSQEGCNSINMQSFNDPLVKKKRKPADKCGKFTHRLTVKKPLASVDVSGDRSAGIGQYVKLTVTCKGSYPSSLCWNVTALNSSQPSLNATCPPGVFKETCIHSVQIKLLELGWKTVWFTVYNDVSYMTYPINVYCYDPDPVNVAALTIPLVFGVFGLIVIIIGGTYLNRLRKKPLVEVADFDFHPSVSTENRINIFSRLFNKIKVTWKRKTYSRRNIRRNNTDEDTSLQSASSLYDSL